MKIRANFKLKFLTSVLVGLSSFKSFAQSSVEITIGYPDHESHFIYTISVIDEHARFGGEYYVEIKNTGSTPLNNWELFTRWKTLNSTWGVVNKTVLNHLTGDIKLTGPNWSPNIGVGESIILNGEWISTGNVEDWIDFLPRNISFFANGEEVDLSYNTSGEIQLNNYTVQKVKPITNSRKTFSDLKVVAYFPLFDLDNAWCALQRYGSNIDQLRVQLYSITPNGELSAAQGHPANIDPIVNLDYWYDVINELGVVDFCQTHNIELVPVIFNYNEELGDFDAQGVHNMMTNPQKRASHLAEIVDVLERFPLLAGIDVDYESLFSADRNNYSLFMEDLADLVHAKNKILTTAVHTKVGPGTWYGPQAQDYERIGNAVDEILLMTYDLHWATSPTFTNAPPTAGCQSTPDWIQDIAFFAVSEIDDPSKIQIGMPFYGYRWKYGFENHTLTDPGVGLTYQDAMQLMSQYDYHSLQRESNGQELNFVVDIDGVDWVCYYQDSTSIAYKLEGLLKHDLRDYIGGVGVWRLGSEDDQLWDALIYHTKGNTALIGDMDCNQLNPNLGEKPNKENLFLVYPNPTQEQLYITSSQEIKFLQLLDISGRVILVLETNAAQIIELDTDELNPGKYMLEVVFENGMTRTEKIVKH
jgi:spore germination protein